MSGPLDVNRIKVAGGARSSAMPDKQISLDIHLPHGKQLTMQVTPSCTLTLQLHPIPSHLIPSSFASALT